MSDMMVREQRADCLHVELAGTAMRNPVLTASGCFGWGREYSQYYPLHQLGGVCAKAVTEHPRDGNAVPRVTEVTAGMLNAIGLANPGLEEVLQSELPWLASQDVCVWVNIAGAELEEYCSIAQAVAATNLAQVLELNVSCPNVKQGGLAFGTDPDVLKHLVAEVRGLVDMPLFVKLSPNVTDIRPLAEAAVEGGADGLTLINTLRGMAVDVANRRPILSTVHGGLSGPAIKPVALSMVYQVAKVVDVPIVGCGGIVSGQDALEFIMVGAHAVQVGTANFTDPWAGPRIVSEIAAWMHQEGVRSLDEIRGSAL